jgi:hypothetical protein
VALATIGRTNFRRPPLFFVILQEQHTTADQLWMQVPTAISRDKPEATVSSGRGSVSKNTSSCHGDVCKLSSRQLANKFAFITGLLFAVVVYSPLACASTINVSGAPANWLVSGAGASGAVPFLVNAHLTITSNQNETGTFVSGGALASFDGFWYGVDSFSLPGDAINVSLSFSSFSSDDRAVLELNGVIIGNSGNGAPGLGSMNFTDGGALQPFNFTNVTAGTTATGFNIGGTNTLAVIVNNTSTGLTGVTRTFQALSDNTFFKLNGTVTYTDAAPEPASLILAALGGVALLLGSSGFLSPVASRLLASAEPSQTPRATSSPRFEVTKRTNFPALSKFTKAGNQIKYSENGGEVANRRENIGPLNTKTRKGTGISGDHSETDSAARKAWG